MRTFSCQSGSNGNCIFVQGGESAVLLDAGISGRAAEQRLAGHGFDIRRLSGVVLSHDHNDHVRSAGIFQRKFGVPIYSTEKTFLACRHMLGAVHDVRFFRAGQTIGIGPMQIHTHPTPHDGVDGVCFVVEHERKRLGVLTDLGFVFPELEELLGTLDGVYLESNYDPGMLRVGPYPHYLKVRITGEGGHLSNAEAAGLLNDFTDGRLKWAALAHLSEMNNTPQLALKASRRLVRDRLPIHVADRYGASPLWAL